MVRAPYASATAAGRSGRSLSPICGPPQHAHGGHPAAGADRGAHGVVNYVAYSPNLMKPLHTHFSLDAYRVNKYSDRADPHFPGLPDCLPLAPVLLLTLPYVHDGAAATVDGWPADEAGMIAGLIPVPTAARGARGTERREGVEWTCADA